MSLTTLPITISPTVRALVVVALLAAANIGVIAAARSLLPKGIELPATSFAKMPNQFGPWVGESFSVDPKMEHVANAADSIHRIYRDTEDRRVSLYCAVWTGYGVGLRHSPEVCYPGRGHRILNKTDLELQRPDGSPARARLLTVEHGHQPAYVLFWYEFGGHYVVDHHQFRNVRWNFRGMESWPPMVKVMLQTSGDSEATSQELLRDLGEKVLAWTTKKL